MVINQLASGQGVNCQVASDQVDGDKVAPRQVTSYRPSGQKKLLYISGLLFHTGQVSDVTVYFAMIIFLIIVKLGQIKPSAIPEDKRPLQNKLFEILVTFFY